MYIHKIVIDANHINAKGILEEMSLLEAYHDAGVLEILKTSTLNSEFCDEPFFKKKADKYQMIGGNGFTPGLEKEHPEVLKGGVIGRSHPKLFRKLFPENKTGKDFRNSLRDSYHIEQAILNHCDYFLTSENRLLEGGTNIPEIRDHIHVTESIKCLDEVKGYFYKHYGCSEPEYLKNILESEGPIMIGSNSCYGFDAIDPETGETILSAFVENNKVLINAAFFDKKGRKQLQISSGNKAEFTTGDLSISCGGRGGIVIGESSTNHFMVGSDDEIKLAARVTHTGRVVFFIVRMNASDPRKYISVNKEYLIFNGMDLTS